METITRKIEKILEFMGFQGPKITIDEEHRKISLFIDDETVRNQTPSLLGSFEHLFNLILRRDGRPSYIVDLNYYRRERERLITELARAAAKKVMITKIEVNLPPMNAYERRLVHLEITSNPELATESRGEGKDRYIIIKQLNF